MANSREYRTIGINVAVSTVTGVSSYPKTRPDVTGVGHDDTVDIVEVPFSSDSLSKLEEKGEDTLDALGDRAHNTATEKCVKKSRK